MKFAESSLKEFTDKLASKSPTPGGGSVAGLCSALSAALNSMVVNLTKENSFGQSGAQLSKLKTESLDLMDEDAESFKQVMSAFKLPKNTEAEKEKRTKAIQTALVGAAESPLKIMKLGLEILKLGTKISEKGNVNAVSDAGVGALLALTAVKGGYYNVLINAESLKDESAAEKLESKADQIVQEAEKLAAEINEMTEKRIRA
ncbi:cyclodeaminase/cyclohydrolase family protein [Halanaerobium praevalens]|uniref:Formiminotransferase-cyclodeaminase n=1 Tax=Halanaerobium praevalens (strain ATCC 33744 / DSM 2228 / GSL) TaxID=572479 RepID=E3DLY8_HALPG|nr:cyclodeaminase/cyclohydrolase family protein [Halanaerobium praevalens]ADO76247.1 Formiminotransferase-cyclodeaminase [Halanaerobium praevalens DSM 2228]